MPCGPSTQRSWPTPAPVDFYCSEAHYADHLWPVWDALGEDERGWFWAEQRCAAAVRARGLPARVGRPRGARRLVVVAGASDAWAVRALPVALIEHGAGQAYDADDPGWSGGSRRDPVVVFLCPNDVSAGRNRAAYPDAAVEVVGSPRVERLRSIAGTSPDGRGEATGSSPSRQRRQDGPPAVALSFHHMGNGKAPECGWALPHYEEALPTIVGELQAMGLEVLGHGHPRALKRFRLLWRSLGVEHVERFDEVVARADAYACDNSSTLYEAAACGLGVVVLNAPWYRRNVDLWPRFWRCADVGPHADWPDHVAAAIRRALEGEGADRRDEIVTEVYPLIEGSAERSAHALLRVAASLQ